MSDTTVPREAEGPAPVMSDAEWRARSVDGLTCRAWIMRDDNGHEWLALQDKPHHDRYVFGFASTKGPNMQVTRESLAALALLGVLTWDMVDVLTNAARRTEQAAERGEFPSHYRNEAAGLRFIADTIQRLLPPRDR